MLEDDSLISIPIAEVPKYLQSGEFYRSLQSSNGDGEAAVSVPKNCIKGTAEVRNADELRHLLISLQFWLVNEVPQDLVEFCLSECNYNTIKTFSPSDFPIMAGILTILDTPPGSARLVAAAKQGELEILKYLLLHEKNLTMNGAMVCETAAAHGHLQCLILAHQHGCRMDTMTSQHAAESGHLECLRYAHEQGCELNNNCCVAAAANGHLACLQYLHDQGCTWDSCACTAAAAHNQLACLQYLHEHGCAWSAHTCREAASAGNLHILQYLYHNNCPWDATACAGAAHYGHLTCLTFLHTHQCPWSAHTCNEAAYSGHLACLQYAHSEGCPWNSAAVLSAATQGRVDCLRYLLEQGCPCDDSVYNEVLSFSSCGSGCTEGSGEGGSEGAGQGGSEGVVQCLLLLQQAGCAQRAEGQCVTCTAGYDALGHACTHTHSPVPPQSGLKSAAAAEGVTRSSLTDLATDLTTDLEAATDVSADTTVSAHTTHTTHSADVSANDGGDGVTLMNVHVPAAALSAIIFTAWALLWLL